MRQKKVIEMLDILYGQALKSVRPVDYSAIELAERYLRKYGESSVAADKLINNQVIKSGTPGFIAGLGGIITFPVAIPANMASLLYIQLRMVAGIACIGGYRPEDDAVRTFAYICLTGRSAAGIIEKAGIEKGEKITVDTLKCIPVSVLKGINKSIVKSFLMKTGKKSIVKLGEFAPIVGGVVGYGFNFFSSRSVARNAKKIFIEGTM